jgi:predicted nucleotidyltransferase
VTDYRGLLSALADARVEFIIIGGVAAVAHGSSRFTNDVDVVYRRTPNNFQRIVEALKDHSPYLRGAPLGLPFRWEPRTVAAGLNFTLNTNLGAIDLMGEAAGNGTYDSLLPDSECIELFGKSFRVVGLKRLIALKSAAGRPKDLDAIAELQAIDEDRP